MMVQLTAPELMMAATVGMQRNLRALVRGSAPRWAEEQPGILWARHIEGAAAELAVAKATGAYWDGSIDTFNAPDLRVNGVWTEVRWRADGRFLKIRQRDADNAEGCAVVLVAGQSPNYDVIGWIWADWVEEPWLRDPGGRGKPAYFVPAEALMEIEALPEAHGALA